MQVQVKLGAGNWRNSQNPGWGAGPGFEKKERVVPALTYVSQLAVPGQVGVLDDNLKDMLQRGLVEALMEGMPDEWSVDVMRPFVGYPKGNLYA